MSYRNYVTANGIRLSYIDFGGDGTPLLALHGHFGCARSFSTVAELLKPEWHIIALDQRGHGWSDKPEDYSREAYIQDLLAVIEHFSIAPVIILGHSLGGLNAYQLAARCPELVQALIIEDIGANTNNIPIFTPDWPARFGSMKQLIEFMKKKGLDKDPYFLESLVEYPDGWGVRFQANQIILSQQLLHGNWWQDWCASKCPTLLLHGNKSWVLKSEHAREMAAVRPDTWLIEFPKAGHTIHDDEPEQFCKVVRKFLGRIQKYKSATTGARPVTQNEAI